jgi:Trypsin-like peptidase domain
VAGRTVLTAGHVVAGAASATVRFPDKHEVPASLEERFVVVTPGLDLALVEIDDLTVNLPPLPIARVDRAGTDAEIIERVQVVGYPQFAERPAVGRETAHAAGHIPVLAGLVSGLLTVQLTTAAARPAGRPRAVAVVGHLRCAGAGRRLPARRGLRARRQGRPSAITAVPLTLLDPDPVHPRWGPV